MKKEQKHFWTIVCLVFMGMLVWHLLPTLGKGVRSLTPFLIAFATAYLLRHPVIWLEKLLKLIFKSKNGKKGNRYHTFASLFVLLLFLGSASLLIAILIPSIIGNIYDLAVRLPEVISTLENMITTNTEKLSGWLKTDINASAAGLVSGVADKILEYFKSLKLLNLATSFLSSAASTLVSVVMYVISTFFLLHDYESIKNWIKKLLLLFIPDSDTYENVCAVLHKSDVTLEKYIVVRLTTSFCLGVVTYIGFKLFGLPYAVLLATCVAVTNIVPYIGPIVGAIPPILIGLTSINGGVGLGFWVGIFILICQQIEGNIVTPLLTGDALEISPLLVLMGIAVCGAMMGIPGMILGAPIAAVIASVVRGAIKAKEMEIEKNEVKRESADN